MGLLPPTAVLHALIAGTIGTMTLTVMTRASLGHIGQPLAAGSGTTSAYVLVTIAAILRVLAAVDPAAYLPSLWIAGAPWSAAFRLFVVLDAPLLVQPRATAGARPI